MFKRIITYSILTFVTLFGFFGNINLDIVQNNGDIHGVTLSYEGNTAYAAEPCKEGQTPEKDKCTPVASTEQLKNWNSVIDGINMLTMILSTIISPIILFVGWLMSPDWTSGDIFGMRPKMHDLWVTVSNIVYFVYAILLILIALGTMFGKDSFSYKTMLPKLALGIIMVPFTWWFVQMVIAISSVMTAQVMTIPLETLSKSESAWFNTTKSIPKEVRVSSSSGTWSSLSNAIERCKEKDSKCATPKEFLQWTSGMYGPLVVYAYSVFNVQSLKRLPEGIDVAWAALNIVHQSFIWVLMFLVFGLLILALTTILIMRAIKLWVYAIFSPLFTFQFVAGSAIMGEDKDTFTIKEFMGLAFVPAIIWLTLSFGLIMISSIQSSSNISAWDKKGTTCDLTKEKDCRINIMSSTSNYIDRYWKETGAGSGSNTKNYSTITTFHWGTIDFIFEWTATNQTQDSTKSQAIGTLDSIGGIFWFVIVDIIALTFIWLAFMAAKNVSKAVKAVAQPFEDIGNKVGSLAKSIPKYTPIPGTGMSANSMAQVPRSIESALSSADSKRFENSSVGKLLNADKNISTDRDNALVKAIKEWKKDDIAKLMREEGGKEYMYKSESVKAFMDELKGKNMTVQNAYLDKIGIKNTDQQKAIRDFANDNSKNKLETDPDKKAFLGLINTAISTSGTNWTANNTHNNINLNINSAGNEKDIASAIRWSNTEKTITRTDLETALKEKIKKPDGNIDTDKIKKILDEIKDDFFKKPGTSSGWWGWH
jgi:hypothetical protein